MTGLEISPAHIFFIEVPWIFNWLECVGVGVLAFSFGTIHRVSVLVVLYEGDLKSP